MSSSTTSLLSQLFLSSPGPKDSWYATSLVQRLNAIPYPPGPSSWPSPLDKLASPSFHDFSLQAWVPIVFSLIYYVVAHSANHFLVGEHRSARDLTKGPGLPAKTLRWGVIAHNAFLALYSGWTFYNVWPVVIKFFTTGYKAAGFDGAYGSSVLVAVARQTLTF